MSKSYKGEARAQARIAQARRAARKAAHSNFESPDNFLESSQARALCKKTVVDASPRSPSRWTPPGRA